VKCPLAHFDHQITFINFRDIRDWPRFYSRLSSVIARYQSCVRASRFGAPSCGRATVAALRDVTRLSDLKRAGVGERVGRRRRSDVWPCSVCKQTHVAVAKCYGPIAIARASHPRTRLSRFRAPDARDVMEVEPMCIVENETVSARFFGGHTAWQCARARDADLPWGKDPSVLRARTAGLRHIVQRGRAPGRIGRAFRASDDRDGHARIAIDLDTLTRIDCDRGRWRGEQAGDGREGCRLSWPDISFVRSSWRLNGLAFLAADGAAPCARADLRRTMALLRSSGTAIAIQIRISVLLRSPRRRRWLYERTISGVGVS